LVEIFATGKSPADLNRLIQEKFDVSFTNADRLIRTEMSYIQNRSTIDKYKQAGITHYRILSTSDSCHTCADESLVHNIDKAITGVNLPPLHPNCKCTILAVMED
jgi:SPP1 gp7 family putative phage head morphogenesis protein